MDSRLPGNTLFAAKDGTMIAVYARPFRPSLIVAHSNKRLDPSQIAYLHTCADSEF